MKKKDRSSITLCVDARISGALGIGRFVRQLIPFLNSPPFQLLLLVNREGLELYKDYRRIFFPAPIYSVQEQLLFPIKVPQCDLFWSPHYNIPLLPIRAKKRIVTIHDTCHLRRAQFFPLLKRTAARYVMKKAFQNSDCVTTVSDFSRNELQFYFGKDQKIETIPLGVDHFSRTYLDEEELRSRYQLPKRFLLFVSNFLPHKNHGILIEAFQKLAIPDLGLVFVGKGKKFKQEKICWLGEIADEELASLYGMAELFVFPSLYEGFGLPPLEAMLHGCPTLVSFAGSLPEICGDASLYFNPCDSEELRRMILKILGDQNLREALVGKGRERVKKFSWEETARRYRELFVN